MSEIPQHQRLLRFGAIAAVIAAPLTLALLQFLGGLGAITVAPLVLIVGILISGATMLVLGVPWILLLRRMRWLNAVNVCMGAVLAGVTATAVLMLAVNEKPGWGTVVMGALSGLVSGAAFCMVSGVRLWHLRY